MRGHYSVLSLLAGLAACGSPTPYEFPVGIFGVDSAEAVRELSGRGFNALQPAGDAAATAGVLAEADARGMLVLPAPPPVGHELPARPRKGERVWYIQDEPDVHGVSLARLSEMDALMRDRAPGERTAFVVGDGRKAKDYPGVSDAIMVDWYPVPHLPLESAGDQVRLTAAVAGGRRVWAVLQAMDWRDFTKGRTKGLKTGRFPDLSEIRFMSYDAILGGAQGVWYFTYSLGGGRDLSKTPELLFAVSWAARELRALAPVFARGRPVPLPFPAPADGWAARAWTYRGRDYLILANRTKDRFWRVPPQALEPGWRPLFEVRRDPRELLYATHGAHYLRPYQVLVLESRVKPGRLIGR